MMKSQFDETLVVSLILILLFADCAQSSICRFKFFHFAFDFISMMIMCLVDLKYIVEHVQDVNNFHIVLKIFYSENKVVYFQHFV